MPRTGSILLLVDNRARDADCILLIRQWLRTWGYQVFLCNKRNWRISFERHRPAVFAISTGISLGPGSEDFWSRYADQCRIVIIPQEGATPEENGRRTKDLYGGAESGGSFTKKLTRIYMWGKQTADWTLDAGIFEPDQVMVTGTPRLDPYRLQPTFEQRPLGFREDSAQKQLGFATNCDVINVYNHWPLIRTLNRYREYEGSSVGVGKYHTESSGMEDYIWLQCRTLRNDYEIIDRVPKSNGRGISIRPHPLENENAYGFLRRATPTIEIPTGLRLHEWLPRLYCMLTYYSTTSVDALLSGIPVISAINTLGPKVKEVVDYDHFLNPTFSPYIWKPDTMDETLEMIEAAHSGQLPFSPNPTGFAKFLVDFYDWPRKEPSSMTIARDIAQLATSERLIPKHSNWESYKPPGKIPQLIGPRVPGGWCALLLAQNMKAIYRDIRSRTLKSNQRYNFYDWHRSDFQRVSKLHSGLFSSVKEVDLVAKQTPER